MGMICQLTEFPLILGGKICRVNEPGCAVVLLNFSITATTGFLNFFSPPLSLNVSCTTTISGQILLIHLAKLRQKVFSVGLRIL